MLQRRLGRAAGLLFLFRLLTSIPALAAGLLEVLDGLAEVLVSLRDLARGLPGLAARLFDLVGRTALRVADLGRHAVGPYGLGCRGVAFGFGAARRPCGPPAPAASPRSPQPPATRSAPSPAREHDQVGPPSRGRQVQGRLALGTGAKIRGLIHGEVTPRAADRQRHEPASHRARRIRDEMSVAYRRPCQVVKHCRALSKPRRKMAPGRKDNCNWLRRAVYNRTIGHPSRLSFPLLKGLFMPAYKALFMLIIVGAIAALGVFTSFPACGPPLSRRGSRRQAASRLPSHRTKHLINSATRSKRTTLKPPSCTVRAITSSKSRSRQSRRGSLPKPSMPSRLHFQGNQEAEIGRGRVCVRLLDPFPPVFEVRDVKKEGNDKATALIEFKSRTR